MIKKILILFIRMLPLRRFIILESHPDFSDNALALFDELIRRGVHHRYRIYWMKNVREAQMPDFPENVHTFENDCRTLGEMVKRAYILNCSRFIFDSNSFINKRRRRQVRVHLGHGMPIKIDLEYSRKFGECDKYMVQSEFWKEIYREQIQVPEEILCYLGYPRNDVLLHKTSHEKWQHSVEDFKRVIVWMPTYRQHRRHMERAMENEYPYGMPCVHDEEELKRLNEALKNDNILILFRPHPVQELSVFQKQDFSHICIADDQHLGKYGISLYELLGSVDGLITDYSSVYFDYLLTDKPIALTIEDREEYFRHFTPAFPDYKKYIKGYYVESFGGLLDFLKEMASGEDSTREERRAAKKMFHSETGGRSAERIVDMLCSEYGL